MIYFTSDTHFGHKNIIRFCDRPFKDVNEMNEILVKNWNDTVGVDDTVYFLGDFAMSFTPVETITPRLNGRKILIAGNHDHCHPTHKKSNTMDKFIEEQQNYALAGWDSVCITDYINIGGEVVTLSHFPYKEDNTDANFPNSNFDKHRRKDDGGWLLCGHIHEKWRTKGRMINVGVDVWDYKPVSIDVIKGIINDGA